MYIGMSALLAESAQMNGLDYFLAVIALLAGLGAFLFGFKILSDNIEKLATNKLRRWFDKTSKSRLAGVGIGAGVTAIIQSSSATTVMVVGFVNVGLMSLFQATAVIMGANIGTTVTAYFSVIADIPFIEIITVFTCVGIFMDMLCKKDKSKTVGMMLAGLGLVFLGLEYMGMAMDEFAQQQIVKDFLVSHFSYNSGNWLPIVTRREAQSEQNPGDSGGGTENPSGSGERQYVFDFSRTAVFRDGSYVFTLDERGTAGLAYVNSRIEEGSLTVKDEVTGDVYNYFIVTSRANKKFDPDAMSAETKLKMELILKEVLSASDAYGPEDVEPDDGNVARIKESVESDIEEAFEECRAYGVDIFDLYGGFYGKGGAEWRDNDSKNYLARTRFVVDVEITFH